MTTATETRVFTDDEWASKCGELVIQVDNLKGDLLRVQAKYDDARVLLVEAKDHVPAVLRQEITDVLAMQPLDRAGLLRAQKRLCERGGLPHFAPYTGICRCGADIVDEGWATGHVTGCPKCHRSFCD